jgi:hypothetical protein
MTVMAGLILLPVLFMAQVLPQPLGQFTMLVVLGAGYGTARQDPPVPRPPSAPAEECDCGVPSSPRGPR